MRAERSLQIIFSFGLLMVVFGILMQKNYLAFGSRLVETGYGLEINLAKSEQEISSLKAQVANAYLQYQAGVKALNDQHLSELEYLEKKQFLKQKYLGADFEKLNKNLEQAQLKLIQLKTSICQKVCSLKAA